MRLPIVLSVILLAGCTSNYDQFQQNTDAKAVILAGDKSISSEKLCTTSGYLAAAMQSSEAKINNSIWNNMYFRKLSIQKAIKLRVNDGTIGLKDRSLTPAQLCKSLSDSGFQKYGEERAKEDASRVDPWKDI